MFSGPQIQPWECQVGALDAQCNQPPQFSYLYQPAGGGELEPYDIANPPGDVSMTTTDEDETVPFIVRIEKGYQDRDQYKVATLFEPGEPWKPWDQQAGWNGKLVLTHGYGCGVSYGAGSAPAVDDDLGKAALARGFAVGSTALDNNSHNCNIAVQAESLVMLKEHIVETRGPIRYTIASGCSGGSVVQQQVANAYPGIYQGLTPQCSYPDTFSPGAQFADYNMLRQYFENPSRWGPGVTWLPTQWAQVEGHVAFVNAITADEGLFKSAINPQYACDGTTAEIRFHPVTNPNGVRCDALSYMINVLGPRPPEVWTPVEKQIGRGFAGVPFGNQGVQYGLGALQEGSISTQQFVDLNANIGGLSMDDLSPTPQRLPGDDGALADAYRSGVRPGEQPRPGGDDQPRRPRPGPRSRLQPRMVHAGAARARAGPPRQHVMWFGLTPIVGDLTWATKAVFAMDRWLEAVEADKRKVPLSRKIVEDRPGEIRNQCEAALGLPLPSTVCDIPLAQTRFGTPRTVAGDSIASDIGACTLKPLRRVDYYPINFTDAQWGALQAAFPTGVCDWAQPGRGQQDTIAWLTYQNRKGEVVYGGKRLRAAPKASGLGWTSKAFAGWTTGE